MPRKYEDELRIQAQPDAVWKALTEAEGIQSWFAPEARVNPGEGGSVWVSWGPGMEGESRISAWEPNRRFAYTQDREGREASVVEFVIEGQGGNTTLRLVQSGFGGGASFDDEYETTSRAWKLFFRMLKQSLETPHREARNVPLFRLLDLARADVWRALEHVPEGGEVVFDDGVGYRLIEYPELNRSVTGIFCEKCGEQTALTLLSVLYDPAPGVEERIRREWTAVAESEALAATRTPASPAR